MSAQTAVATKPAQRSQAPVTDLAESLRAVESLAGKYSLVALAGKGEIERAFMLAEGVQALRGAMLPLVPRIMPLMNTRLGFLTDRDPKKDKEKTPYSMEVVADVVVEATLRGFRLCGNEFNILFGGFYATKEGYQRVLSDLPGFANLKTALGVPKALGQGVVIRCSAEWTFAGKPMQLTDENGKPGREIAVKLQSGQGVDAALGKAERRLYKIIYSMLTGSDQADDEPGASQLAAPRDTPPANGAAVLPAPIAIEKPLDETGEVANDEQLAKLASLDGVVSADELTYMLSGYGVTDERNLTAQQAADLIERLQRTKTRNGAALAGAAS